MITKDEQTPLPNNESNQGKENGNSNKPQAKKAPAEAPIDQFEYHRRLFFGH